MRGKKFDSLISKISKIEMHVIITIIEDTDKY